MSGFAPAERFVSEVKSRKLRPDSVLTGEFVHDETEADVGAVLEQIEEARREAEIRERGRREAEEAERPTD